MLSIERVLDQLRESLATEARLIAVQADLDERFWPGVQGIIANAKKLQNELLLELVRYPPQHARHANLLDRFYRFRPAGLDRVDAPPPGGTFENSVFVMTKFPERNDTPDQELGRVIGAVLQSVNRRQLIGRVANDAKYHAQLWDNVELYMLACSRGIVILEDRYRPELNPNVAFEWGWMRAMGREMLCLREEGFRSTRADQAGFLADTFPWAAPEKPIQEAVSKWLDMA